MSNQSMASMLDAQSGLLEIPVLNDFPVQVMWTSEWYANPSGIDVQMLLLRHHDLGKEVADAIQRVRYGIGNSKPMGVIVGADVVQRHLEHPIKINWDRFSHKGMQVLGCPTQLLGWAQGITVYLRD